MPFRVDSETGRLRDVLLCRPEYYRWIDTNAVAHATLAAGAANDPMRLQAQYRELESALGSAGVTLHYTAPEAQLPYQVYTRDSSQTTPWGPVLTHARNAAAARGICLAAGVSCASMAGFTNIARPGPSRAGIFISCGRGCW